MISVSDVECPYPIKRPHELCFSIERSLAGAVFLKFNVLTWLSLPIEIRTLMDSSCASTIVSRVALSKDPPSEEEARGANKSFVTGLRR
jgi:hypothetical protein